MKPKHNVNVTLADAGWFAGKEFPCPVCGAIMPLRTARTGKPYCQCDPCGIQLFFRGKNGIQKLRRLLATEVFVSGASRATVLLNRLEQLKEQRNRLNIRQGIIFRDKDLAQAIQAVDSEIEAVRGQLAEINKSSRRTNQ